MIKYNLRNFIQYGKTTGEKTVLHITAITKNVDSFPLDLNVIMYELFMRPRESYSVTFGVHFSSFVPHKNKYTFNTYLRCFHNLANLTFVVK